MTGRGLNWTFEAELCVIRAHLAGKSIPTIAEMSGRNEGSVRWKLLALGMVSSVELNGGAPDEDSHVQKIMANKRSDLAFKQAMLREIKNGTEDPFVGTYRAGPSTRYIPIRRGENIAPIGQSVAATCADLGEKGGWMS